MTVDGGLPTAAGLRTTGRLALKLFEGNVVDLSTTDTLFRVDDETGALIARDSVSDIEEY